MAELAKCIRRRVNTVLALESDRGHLRQMHKAFKDNLIADLSDDAFADMFAQTITYGLFTARASQSSGALVADNLADMGGRVGGDGQTLAFVPLGYQFEQHGGLGLIAPDMAQVIQNQQVKPVQLGQLLRQNGLHALARQKKR